MITKCFPKRNGGGFSSLTLHTESQDELEGFIPLTFVNRALHVFVSIPAKTEGRPRWLGNAHSRPKSGIETVIPAMPPQPVRGPLRIRLHAKA